MIKSMTQKGFAPIIIVSIVAILVGLVGGIYLFNKQALTEQFVRKTLNQQKSNPSVPTDAQKIEDHKDTVPNIVTRECTNISKLVIKQKELEKVSTCLEQSFSVDGQGIHYVDITYGDLMDCPSGCIYSHYYGIVENNKITDFFPLREDLLNTKLFTLNPSCSLNTDYQFKIAKLENSYKWKISFNRDGNELCILKGTVYSSKEGDFDTSNLKYTIRKVNCNDPQIAQEMCSKRREVYGGSCNTTEEQKSGCQVLAGEIDCNDPDIARQFCIPLKGDKNCNDKQENLNYCLTTNKK